MSTPAQAQCSLCRSGSEPPQSPPQQPGGSSAEAVTAQEPEKDLDTAYVQDMLATDPVVALGLRVVGSTSAALEYVSIDEAKQDLSVLLR